MAPRKVSKQKPSSTSKREYVTLSIPKELYKSAEIAINGTGFRSVTEYAVFLLREALLMRPGKNVRDRLRELGYIE